MLNKPKYQVRFQEKLKQATRELKLNVACFIDNDGIRLDAKCTDDPTFSFVKFGCQFDLIGSLDEAIAKLTDHKTKTVKQ